MSIGDILKPKSKEEIKDLERRGFRKDGGKWRFSINIEDIINDYDTDEDTGIFRLKILDLLKTKIDDVGILTKSDELIKFENIVSEFDMLDPSPDPDEIDNILGKKASKKISTDEFISWEEVK
jgi:hypothetical protein